MGLLGKTLGFAVLAVVVGCASVRKYEEVLDNWVGRDSESLVARWGKPNSVHSFPDGDQMYEYRFGDSHGGKEREGRSVAGGIVGCKTYFFVDKEKIVRSWKWEGHDCVVK